jgi:hypothetical protein
MILSLLYLGLVFYFPLEITETRVVYSFSFVQQFPKSCPHPEVRERERERDHATYYEEQQKEQLQTPQQVHNMWSSTPKCGIHQQEYSQKQ